MVDFVVEGVDPEESRMLESLMDSMNPEKDNDSLNNLNFN